MVASFLRVSSSTSDVDFSRGALQADAPISSSIEISLSRAGFLRSLYGHMVGVFVICDVCNKCRPRATSADAVRHVNNRMNLACRYPRGLQWV